MCLLQLQVPTDRVPDHHPGEPVFDDTRYLSLFSYPETLTLASCNFVPGRSRTDSKLISLSPGKPRCFYATCGRWEAVTLCFRPVHLFVHAYMLASKRRAERFLTSSPSTSLIYSHITISFL